jgi:hypothetical protein
LSKDEKNDILFHQEGLIAILLDLVTIETKPDNVIFEVLLYSMGTLKNVSANESNQQEVARLGGVQILTNWLEPDRIQAIELYLDQQEINSKR